MAAVNGESKTPNTETDYTDFAHTGPDTLAGRYLRMYWHVVQRSEDVAAGWAVPIKIMNEEFTLYRGESGTPHLVAFRCAHRGTQLSSGWVEDDCIRCRYHGWKYDGSGQCVDQPMEDPSFGTKVRIKSFPVQEYLGLIFAYLGEEEPPPLPRYAPLEEEGVLENDVLIRACNWVNNVENDFGHGPFTHRNIGLPKGVFYVPEVTVQETEAGFKTIAKYPNGDVRIAYRGIPNTGFQKSPPRDPALGWRSTFLIWEPMDDGSFMQFRADLTPVTGEAAHRYEEARQKWAGHGGKEFDPELSQEVLEGKLRLDDIERSRADINITRVQDDVTQIGQGVIRDRSQELLGRSDAQVLLVREIWRRELRAFAEGRPIKRGSLPDDLIVTGGGDSGQDLKYAVYER